jgi:hypothetical protein
MMFQATSASEVLIFLANGTPGGEPPVAVPDGVPLTASPEPGYYALMLVGIGILVFAARRGSKSVRQPV